MRHNHPNTPLPPAVKAPRTSNALISLSEESMKLIEQQLATPKANKRKRMPAATTNPSSGTEPVPVSTESKGLVDKQSATPVAYKRRKKAETAATIDQLLPKMAIKKQQQTLVKEVAVQQSSGGGCDISAVVAQLMSLEVELSKEKDVNEQLEIWKERSGNWKKKLIDAMRHPGGI